MNDPQPTAALTRSDGLRVVAFRIGKMIPLPFVRQPTAALTRSDGLPLAPQNNVGRRCSGTRLHFYPSHSVLAAAVYSPSRHSLLVP